MLAFRKPIDDFLGFVFPPACRICRARLENGGFICAQCEKLSSRLQTPFCSACKQIISIEAGSPCPSCLKPTSMPVFALGVFDLHNRELIHRLKYYGDEPAGRFLGTALGKFVTGFNSKPACDAIVPVPLHWTRKWSRGFNQSLILARALSKTTGLPMLPALRRVKRTKDQTRLSRQERLANVRGAFRVVRDVKGKRLLLLDDVTTTGATLEECRRVLENAGASQISAAVVAMASEN
jgi:ComF family protein